MFVRVFFLSCVLTVLSQQALAATAQICVQTANVIAAANPDNQALAQQGRINCIRMNDVSVPVCQQVAAGLPDELSALPASNGKMSMKSEILDACSIKVGNMTFDECLTMASLYPSDMEKNLGVVVCMTKHKGYVSDDSCMNAADSISELAAREAAKKQICQRQIGANAGSYNNNQGNIGTFKEYLNGRGHNTEIVNPFSDSVQ